MFLPRDPWLRRYSQRLRRGATRHEDRLWYEFLKDVRPRFSRQRVIGSYIVDFFCHKALLVVELDGSQHYLPEAMERDKKRTEYFNSFGIIVIRFPNKEVDENFTTVCEAIVKAQTEQLKKAPKIRRPPPAKPTL